MKNNEKINHLNNEIDQLVYILRMLLKEWEMKHPEDFEIDSFYPRYVRSL